MERESHAGNPDFRQRKSRLTSEFPTKLFSWLDAQASKEKKSRAQIIREALEVYRALKDNPGAEVTYKGTKGQEIKLFIYGVTEMTNPSATPSSPKS